MSEESKRFGVRRIGRKDQKKRLEETGALFPPEPDLPPEEATAPEPPEVDEALPGDELFAAPDDVDAALSALRDLNDVSRITSEMAALSEAVSGAGKPRRPPEELDRERFPPVRPMPPADPVEPPPQAAPAPRRRGLARQDRIALLFALGTILAIVYFVVLWQDPQSPLNFFAPATPFVIVTATPQPQPTQAPTDPPTPGPTASFTPLGLAAVYPFALADTGVLYIPNDNGRACNWSSIAGSVISMEGEPVNGFGVQISGEGLDEKVFSGTAQTFGPGGFELFLNGVPQQAEYSVQLLSPAGTPVSEKIPVSTRAECDQNVAVVNFIQKRGL